MTVIINGTTGIDKVVDGSIGTVDLVDGAVTPAKLSQPMTSGTAWTYTSGTPSTIDFTGIPIWVKRITVMFDGISLSGTDNLIVQIGDSGGARNHILCQFRWADWNNDSFRHCLHNRVWNS